MSFMFAVALSAAPGCDLALTDLQWTEKAARLEAATLAAGQLAGQQGGAVEVRDFGEATVAYHRRVAGELNALATARGADLPTVPDATHERLLRRLAGLKGNRFDRVYITSAGLQDATNAIRLFEHGAAYLKDPELKAYARRILPVLKENYDLTRDVKQATDYA